MKNKKLLAFFDSCSERELRVEYLMDKKAVIISFIISSAVLLFTGWFLPHNILNVSLQQVLWMYPFIGIILLGLILIGIIFYETNILLKHGRDKNSETFNKSWLFVRRGWYGWYIFILLIISILLFMFHAGFLIIQWLFT